VWRSKAALRLYAPRVRRAVFLDRDNTVIANCGDLGDPERVVLLPGAGEAVATLRDAGFTLVVVTNQGGVARGRYDDAAVHAVHDRLATLLNGAGARPPAIEAFYYCPYHPEGTVAEYRREHPWRKPAPGMLLQAAADLGLDLASSWLIGDAPRDIEAGRNAGCRAVLIGSTPCEGADAVVPSVLEAARVVVARSAIDGARPPDPLVETMAAHLSAPCPPSRRPPPDPARATSESRPASS
jgi:D-glycero-D-manno-heptose 1,7-bisphosphate phosphatase